ncbi:MAG: twin-arginine translocation signal domain-containing protein [Chloroflexi bacterium]|nr:twin-arginine translocation signal domain-containing protein [Chloroflexota bacterium]MBV9548022.1 twin-arginine translocation signal domain-containing protein [Chloroflexota bacterium]
MTDLTRRGFLGQASVMTGAGVVGGLGLHQLLTRQPGSDPATAPGTAAPPDTAWQTAPSGAALDSISLDGPMIVHLRDVATAEVSMMVGTHELVYRDPELVSRLIKTATSVSHAGA